jgi:lipopolysaccharide biosynthesis glycosyltransferase
LINSYDVVFCIDKNFNKQAFLSIASFYKTNINFENKLYIIHKSPNSFKKYLNKLENHFPDKTVELIKFKFNIKHYPNLKRSHVSEATYYRMFISDHIINSSPFIIYIDADAFFIEDVSEAIYKIVNALSSKNLLLSAKTEHIYDESPELFKRLNINEKYFNAGVMVINFKKWRNENISQKLKDQVDKIKESINYWDQDVLNSLINGKYLELPKELNYTVEFDSKKIKASNHIKILHYSGKRKPWDKKGNSLKVDSYYKELEKFFTK